MPRHLVLIPLLCLTLIAAGGEADDPPNPSPVKTTRQDLRSKAPDCDLVTFDAAAPVERWELVFDQAGPGGKPLTVHVWRRGERFGQAWAESPSQPGYAGVAMVGHPGFYNLPPECGLKVEGGRLTGRIYRGNPGSFLEVQGAVNGTTVSGTFTGTVTVDRDKTAEVKGFFTGRILAGKDLDAAGSPLPQEAAVTCWRNGGAGLGYETGAKLIDDPSQAKLLWKSEELALPPYHEGINFQKPVGLQGGHASPVLAEGRIFLPQFIGVVDEAADPKGVEELWPTSMHIPREMVLRKVARLADQTLTAIDAATGRTLWRFVEPAGGPNISRGGSDSRHKLCGPSSKAASHLTPCLGGGRVYFKTTGSRIHCLDAATGAVVWQTAPAQKPECGGWDAHTDSLQYADGVMATLHAGGLTGFDGASGQVRWTVKGVIAGRGMTALRYVAGGTESFLTPLGQCLEPKTGKVRWQAEGVSAGGVIAADDRFLVIGTPESIACYEVGSGKPVWKKTDLLQWRTITPAIVKGHAYIRAVTPDTAKSSAAKTYCVDLASGRILGTASGTKSFSSVTAGDGHIFNANAALVIYQDADPARFRDLLATGDAPSNTVADVSMKILLQGTPETTGIYADGRFYSRTFDGIVAYDLRAMDGN
jgi:outer membrane protein assembly factor BamB